MKKCPAGGTQQPAGDDECSGSSAPPLGPAAPHAGAPAAGPSPPPRATAGDEKEKAAAASPEPAPEDPADALKKRDTEALGSLVKKCPAGEQRPAGNDECSRSSAPSLEPPVPPAGAPAAGPSTPPRATADDGKEKAAAPDAIPHLTEHAELLASEFSEGGARAKTQAALKCNAKKPACWDWLQKSARGR